MAGALVLLVASLLGGLSGPDRDARIAALQRRAASATPGTPEARAVADEMGQVGRELLGEGAPGPAIELLAEAYGLDESNGRVLAELTLAYLLADDYESSRFYLQRAGGSAAGAPAEIYGRLGEEYETRQRLDDAAAAWGEAARLSDGDHRTLRRLTRVRDEIALSRGHRGLSTDHFQIFADPDIDEGSLRAAAEALESAYAALSAALGTELTRPQAVVLYSDRAYFSLVSAPDWVAGVFDGKIRVSVEAGGGDGAASTSVLTHELAHALLRVAAGDRAPVWLHEGYAQWSAGRRIARAELAAALGAEGRPSAAALEKSLRGPLDRPAARAVYAQTLSLVEHLMQVRGEGVLACVVARLRAGASMAEALREETGWTEEELFASWKTWAGR